MNDLKFALRQLLKNPGFTAIAVLTLALGIGATTLVFSAIDLAVARPVSGVDIDLLVVIREVDVVKGDVLPVSTALLGEVRGASNLFQSVATMETVTTHVLDDAPERLIGWRVSPQLFGMLGAAPLLGRTFSIRESEAAARNEVILSHNLWQRRYGGDSAVIGTSVRFGEEIRQVVGVMPPNFQFPRKGWLCEYWLPESIPSWQFEQSHTRRHRYWDAIAQLAPGVDRARAQAAVSAIGARLEEQFPKTNKGWRIRLDNIEGLFSDAELRKNFWLLMGAVGCVLVISCANIATLLLIRSEARRREMAVRMALGARRSQLVRLVLQECLLIAAMGALLGALFSVWGASLLSAFGDITLPQLRGTSLSWWAFAFAFLMGALSSLAFGIAPALRATESNIDETLRAGGPTGGGPARSVWQKILVVSEVALAMALLVGAGVTTQTIYRMLAANPGIEAHQMFRFGFYLDSTGISEEPAREARAKASVLGLLQQIRSLPGVQSVGISKSLGSLALTDDNGTEQFRFEKFDCPAGDADPLSALNVRVVAGRGLTPQDALGDFKSVLINETSARRYWPHETPLGRILRPSPPAPGEHGMAGDDGAHGYRIVGIAEDFRWTPEEGRFRDEIMPLMIRPSQTRASDHNWVYLRSELPLASLSRAIGEAIRAHPSVRPTRKLEALDEMIDESLAPRRAFARLFVGFAGVGLAMSVIGVYGVISYCMARRAREFGIRMALGARRRDIASLVARLGLGLGTVGVGIGWVATWMLTRSLESFLFGISAMDLATLVGVSGLLIAVSTLASVVPAVRAARVNPAETLRSE